MPRVSLADLDNLCPVMEIPAPTCSHCRRLPDLPPRSLSRPFTAAYSGRCIDCGEPFEPGDRIRIDAGRGPVGPCCAEDGD